MREIDGRGTVTSKTKEIILRALQKERGDDPERAERSFGDTDLTVQHGQSGKTRQQILDEYRKNRKEIDIAMAEVRAL